MYTRLLILFILVNVAGAGPLYAQFATLDWKMHDVGKVRQVVTNMGTLWRAQTNYPGLLYSEFPPGSYEEHIGEGGIWVGGITPAGDTLVSVASGWGSSFEFYPSAEPWDTVWVAQRGDTLDIPYWPGYQARSDQDFVTRYSDYHAASRAVTTHQPMYLDVIQTSYAWASAPLDEMIVYNFYVVPTEFDLKQVYISYWLDGNVGYRGDGWDFALDDRSVFIADRNLGLSVDAPGGRDGQAVSPIGMRIYPPEEVPADSLKWTFNWYPGQGQGSPPGRDNERYQQMAAGEIMRDQEIAMGSQFMMTFGPFDVAKGDTLHFRVGQLMGEGMEGVLANADVLDWLVDRDFQVPAPPPSPPVRVATESRQAILRWEAQAGDVDPETYTDPNRADDVAQPFEGYRIYKSTQSASGPWVLLAEFDVEDNTFGQNTGLFYEYVDTGLLNNVEYYYTVTAYSKPDTVANFPSQESSLNANAVTVVPGTAPPETVGQVAVVPNPYRGDIDYNAYSPSWERPPPTRDRWMEQDRRLQFINLPARCRIEVYTLSGTLVQTIEHDDPSQGYEDWNLTSRVGQAIASGIYLFSVEDLQTGEVQVGKFVVIK